MSDLDVDRARGGDIDAFVALVERRQDRMIRVASAILGDRSDADDAIQETLVSIWRELPRLRDAESVRCVERIASSSTRVGWSCGVGPVGRSIEITPTIGSDREMPTTGQTHDDAVAGRDAFRRAFDSLDIDARALLVLRHLEGRTVADIAIALSIREGTVKSRLHTARRSLEAALQGENR